MKILLLLLIFFTVSRCDDSLFCGRSTGSVCDLKEKTKYQECLCDLSASKCDLVDCMRKYQTYSDIFIDKDVDAYEDVSLPENLIKTIRRCQELIYHYDPASFISHSKNFVDMVTIIRFAESSLTSVRLINEWIDVNRKIIKEMEDVVEKLDKKYRRTMYSKSLREWIRMTRKTVEEVDDVVRKLFICSNYLWCPNSCRIINVNELFPFL